MASRSYGKENKFSNHSFVKNAALTFLVSINRVLVYVLRRILEFQENMCGCLEKVLYFAIFIFRACVNTCKVQYKLSIFSFLRSDDVDRFNEYRSAF